MFTAGIYRLTAWLVKFVGYKVHQNTRKYYTIWDKHVNEMKSKHCQNHGVMIKYALFWHVCSAIWLEIDFLETLDQVFFSIANLICTFKLSFVYIFLRYFLVMSTNLFIMVISHSDISYNNFSWSSSCQEKRYQYEILVDIIHLLCFFL